MPGTSAKLVERADDQPSKAANNGAEASTVPIESLPPAAVEALNETLSRIDEPAVRAAVEHTVEVAVRSSMHIGPLPPASELAAYDRAVPGLGREIADNARAEQKHRHQMDRRTGSQEFVLELAGLIVTLLALLAMLGIVAYMVHSGEAAAAAALGGAIIVGVIVALTNYRKAEPTKLPSADEGGPGSD